MTQMCWRCCLATVVLGGGAALGGTVNFDRRYLGVPDFDQVRAAGGNVVGLPGNGTQYCSPTSALNWMAFIANRGYPTLNPSGPINWQVGGDDRYNAATLWLNQMGSNYMNTSPTTGSVIGGIQSGLTQWLDIPDAQGAFTVTSTALGSGFNGTMNDLWEQAAASSLVIMHIGWYNSDAPGPGGVARFTRAGGHSTSLVRFMATGNIFAPTYTIGIRDPADEQTDQQTQSPFATRTFGTTIVQGQFRSPSGTYTGTMNRARIDGYTSGTAQGYFDGFTAIRPTYALNLNINDQQAVFQSFTAKAVGEANSFALLFHTHIVHMAVGLGGSRVFVAGDDESQDSYLWELDPSTSVTRAAAVFPHDPNFQQRPFYLCVGRTGRVFALQGDGSRLSRVDPVEVSPQPDTIIMFDGACFQLAYDDARDRLLAFKTPTGLSTTASVKEFDPDLNHLRTLTTGPIDPTLRFSGSYSRLAQSKATGNVFLTALHQSGPLGGSPWFGEFAVDTKTDTLTLVSELTPDQVSVVKGISIDDRNHVFTTFPDGSGHEYEQIEGVWTRVSPSIMDKGGWGDVFEIGRSRTNYDPAIHDVPGWENVMPDEAFDAIADCPGDANLDGATNGGDLSVLLAQFGEPVKIEGFAADFNGDAIVSGADLSVLLSNFGCDQFK